MAEAARYDLVPAPPGWAKEKMKTQNVAPVFQVADLEKAITHYTDVFGFAEDFRFGDYAGIKLGNACLHICGHSIHARPIGGGTVYIFCDEIDSYYDDIVKKGAHVKSEPQDYPYGMRDFMAVDIDGNHLAFGCESKKA